MPPKARIRRRASSSRARTGAIAAALSLFALCVSALAAGVSLPPPPSRWVTDEAGMLSPETRGALDAKLESYENATGHQVVVWIGTKLGDVPIDDLAVRMFEAWRIGRKGHDDGVLLLVLADERKLDIEVGYGLEDRLPDARAKQIIEDVMVPRLRAGDADGALTQGVDAILDGIEGKPFAPGAKGAPPARDGAPAPGAASRVLLGLLALAFVLLLVTHPSLALNLLFVLGSGGRGGFGGGGFGGGGDDRGFSGGGGRSGGGGARGSW